LVRRSNFTYQDVKGMTKIERCKFLELLMKDQENLENEIKQY